MGMIDVMKILHATAETQRSQIKKYIKIVNIFFNGDDKKNL